MTTTASWVLNDDHTARPAKDYAEAATFEDPARRLVRKDRAADVEVSTVFLGIDHNYSGEGPPLLFETMLFRDGKPLDYQERYATWDEAVSGHARALAYVIKLPK
jgi:hypothetical protein